MVVSTVLPAASFTESSGASFHLEGYLREEPVLNGIVFGTVSRIMHNEQIHIKSGSEFHKVLRHNVMGAGVGTAGANKLTDFVYAATTTSKGLGSEKASFLVFFVRRHKRQFFCNKHLWRRLRKHFEECRYYLQVTVFFLFLQKYLIDNQIFNSNFAIVLRLVKWPVLLLFSRGFLSATYASKLSRVIFKNFTKYD